MKLNLRKSSAVVLSNLLILVILFLAIEGLARVALRMEDQPQSGVHERKHTRYDGLLGWANVPGVVVRDIYGPGADLSITARGFRGTEDFEDPVPEGVTRIVCAGDSFTLGYGVGDEDTWCAHLGRAPGVETVNMGQGGYGADQMYLWYARDATFHHDIVIFAFITDDFERARTSRFLVYSKPILGLSGDTVAPLNVPVPDCSLQAAACDTRRVGIGRVLDKLTMARVAERLVRKVNWRLNRGRRPPPPAADEVEIMRRVLRSTKRQATRRGAELVTVLLPKVEDYANDWADTWRQMAEEEAEQGGWEFWDLTLPLRDLAPLDAARLFRDLDGHYTPEGNRWVADQLLANRERGGRARD